MTVHWTIILYTVQYVDKSINCVHNMLIWLFAIWFVNITVYLRKLLYDFTLYNMLLSLYTVQYIDIIVHCTICKNDWILYNILISLFTVQYVNMTEYFAIF